LESTGKHVGSIERTLTLPPHESIASESADVSVVSSYGAHTEFSGALG
jgi:hypothetical protein